MEPSAVSTSPMEYSDLDVEIDDDDDDGEYEDAQTYHDIDDDDEMDDDEEGEEVDADAVDDDDDDEYDDEDSEDEVERRLGAAIRLRILNDGILEDGASIHIVSLPEGIRYQYHIESTRQDEAVIERSEEGVELMKGGDFGAEELGSFPQRANNRKSLPLATRLLQREIGTYRGERARIGSQLLAQSVIPSTKADFVMRHNSNVYSGQFSTDGNFFYSCSQDFKVRMYDTSNPYNWEHYKTARYEGGRWTITDATLSPDNKMLAYSSITPVVYVSNTQPGAEGTWAMDFCASRRQTRSIIERDFGIWSIRFSGDGRELVAGASDCNLYIYDIETQTTVLKLTGHKDEVNAVCFADVDSPHILYSGSDDTTLKVWDRRSMGSGREAGVFAGHMEGLTYIDSKGDGRYVLSNGKDQTMKLWDIRKMMEPSAFDNLRHQNYQCGFDYRMQQYPRRRGGRRHPQDCSVVTYSGHKVLRTLIRCHFSPPVSSGSRYVYTGSADGQVWIYNLDATTKAVIDVQGAVSSAYGFQRHGGGCVRDASWHPNAGVIAATSWKGMNHDGGNISLHSFNGGGMSDKEVVQLNASEDSSYYSGWAYY